MKSECIDSMRIIINVQCAELESHSLKLIGSIPSSSLTQLSICRPGIAWTTMTAIVHAHETRSQASHRRRKAASIHASPCPQKPTDRFIPSAQPRTVHCCETRTRQLGWIVIVLAILILRCIDSKCKVVRGGQSYSDAHTSREASNFNLIPEKAILWVDVPLNYVFWQEISAMLFSICAHLHTLIQR
jgi:hypothetical protein